jgi:hypothetical protein
MGMRKLLLVGVLVLALSGAGTMVARLGGFEAAAFSRPGSGRCVPNRLNRSALLPGVSVAATPLAGSYDASPHTQISLLGAPTGTLSGVRVSGSLSGSHTGRLVGYSQGDGASFLPSKPFRAGETVTVRGDVRVGSATRRFAYQFVIARQDELLYQASARASRDPGEMQHFHSQPALQPPVLLVTARSPQAAPGYMFAAPYAGPGSAGPMIFDEAGNLVWFDPLPAGTAASNLQVQQYAGAPALTWWQGRITAQGFGRGEELIANGSYRVIARVRAGNGYLADLHDFHITAQGTAVLAVFDPVLCNLSAVGGPRAGAVTDSIFQELDLATGVVRREWHSLDHVGLGESYSPARDTSTQWPFDYFHLNSIDQLATGRTLISARNTSALYELNTLTGQVVARIGGKHSDVKLAPGAATYFQHDATVLSDGTISIFDNGAVPKIHRQSRGIVVAVNGRTGTDSILAQYVHPRPLSSGSQGSMQVLENGDVFLGWGEQPYFSEFSAGGQLLFDAHMRGSYESYRAYRFPWTGAPEEPPAIAVAAPSTGAPVTVYASWNGDTRTASWRVLAGPSPQQLTPVASAARSGFESSITTPAPESYVAVQALDGAGNVLGTSRTIPG